MRSIRVLATGCLIAGCQSATSERQAVLGPPAHLTITGDSQSAPVHTALPSVIQARVLDAQGRGLPQQVVAFAVTAGGGSMFLGSGITDPQGTARDFWTLGTTAGAQSLEVRAIDPVSGQPLIVTTVTAIALPGPTVSQGFTLDTVIAVIDSSFPLPATAQDAYGNPTTVGGIGQLGSLGTVQGTTWFPDSVGRTEFVLGADTLVGLSFPRAGHLVTVSSYGGVIFRDEGDLVADPAMATCHDSSYPQSHSMLYGIVNLVSTRSDSAAPSPVTSWPQFFCYTADQPQQPQPYALIWHTWYNGTGFGASYFPSLLIPSSGRSQRFASVLPDTTTITW